MNFIFQHICPYVLMAVITVPVIGIAYWLINKLTISKCMKSISFAALFAILFTPIYIPVSNMSMAADAVIISAYILPQACVIPFLNDPSILKVYTDAPLYAAISFFVTALVGLGIGCLVYKNK